MAKLHPAMAARAKAVAAAHQHLSATHPRWSSLSPQERFKAVHAHVDRDPGTLASKLTALRGTGAFGSGRQQT